MHWGGRWNALTAIELTRDVFPAFWSPTRDSSISCLKNRLTWRQGIQKTHVNVVILLNINIGNIKRLFYFAPTTLWTHIYTTKIKFRCARVEKLGVVSFKASINITDHISYMLLRKKKPSYHLLEKNQTTCLAKQWLIVSL